MLGPLSVPLPPALYLPRLSQHCNCKHCLVDQRTDSGMLAGCSITETMTPAQAAIVTLAGLAAGAPVTSLPSSPPPSETHRERERDREEDRYVSSLGSGIAGTLREECGALIVRRGALGLDACGA
eukprot:1673193-Rhodomonas_salina.4